MRCTLERIARKPAGSTLQIPHDMQMADVDIWKRSMIGFFVSYKLPFHAVQSIANRIWKTHGLEKTTVMANGFMVFRFNTEAAVEEILARGPWLFGGKAILLQQWQPGFLFDKNKIKTIPVWARLQGLPFPLWNKKGLSLAASMVGKPIACDEATMQCSRLEFARVCIEIDAEEPIVHQFPVVSSLSEEPVTVHVSYEWKPARCATCKVFGHSCKSTGKQQVALEKDLTVEVPQSHGQPMAIIDNVIPEKEATTLELTHTIVHGKAVPRTTSVQLTEILTNPTLEVQVDVPMNETLMGVRMTRRIGSPNANKTRWIPFQVVRWKMFKVKWKVLKEIPETKGKERKLKLLAVVSVGSHLMDTMGPAPPLLKRRKRREGKRRGRLRVFVSKASLDRSTSTLLATSLTKSSKQRKLG
ncbi:hypothetical protein OIU78_008016 [Salix suchowensis]|nr:hypothetical protein OIU78_008016 [Salix suchowensis]